eukprot:TRINITY_DN6391_c0_g2_i1.p1 TRINITY_DN6391_c0_g2~~TRINITY_DN6391_c0_g2_i1.p1  ORF type:complete len:404 (-),score=67.53 TRINITY_DN6391_c0_g2_i1:50-1261(-)
MLQIRAGLVVGAGFRLAQGVVIATRYSCVRQQGFASPSTAKSRFDKELCVLEYQNQQFRIFKQLATCYAFVFTGNYLSGKFKLISKAFSEDPAKADLTALPEMHASSAGLKALCTFDAAGGLEECRKCCGGHGVMLASGIAQHALDYVTYCTAEGDRIILELQCARFLVKSLAQARNNEPVSGACIYLTESLPSPQFSNSNDFKNLDNLELLFKIRARRTVENVGERLRKLKEEQGIPHDKAWNMCAIDLVSASRIHCRFIIIRSFAEEVRKIGDARVKAGLMELCALYGCIALQENFGDWVGVLGTSDIKCIRQAVRELLTAIRPNAIAFTDAFEFPDQVLNSAIGRHDGKVYESLYAAAKASELNKRDPFPGYQHLLKVLDRDFLAENAKFVRVVPDQAKL